MVHGFAVSGSFNVFDDDALLWQAVTGKGIGRYFNDPLRRSRSRAR